jgi:hypothetical protein
MCNEGYLIELSIIYMVSDDRYHLSYEKIGDIQLTLFIRARRASPSSRNELPRRRAAGYLKKH